jgi:enterochelin esterase-like enzyme
MTALLRASTLLGLVALSITSPSWSQVSTNVPPPVPGAKPASVELIKIHGPSLVGNLSGEAVDRDAVVVLPPSYRTSPHRRYPVVYALHGYSIGARQWIQEIHVPQTVQDAFAKGVPEMIVVLPDSKTAYGGSFYSRSVTVGDFETYVTRDVVDFIDGHYRTIRSRLSRGLVGHSMGGYGAARLGMRHPDVYSALYIMSGCCLSPMHPAQLSAENLAAVQAMRSPSDAANLPFGARAALATAAAFSPDPKNPPLFFDLPYRDGMPQESVMARWTANAPLAFFDQSVQNLREYTAIAIDVGDQDGLKADASRFHEALQRYGIEHTFEVYPGTHTSNVAFRFEDFVLPFFGKHLQSH